MHAGIARGVRRVGTSRHRSSRFIGHLFAAIHAPAIINPALLADIRCVFFELDRLEFEFGLEQFFEIGHQPRIGLGHKTNGQPRSAGASCAPDTVNVVFGVERNIEVEHRRNVLDVEPARSHIGAHQQVDLAFLEGVERLQALVLALVAVQRRRLQTFTLKRARQPGAAELAVDKNECLLEIPLAQDLVQGTAFVLVAHAEETLLHRRRGGVGPGHFDGDRVLQIAARQPLDLGGKGGREEQCRSLLGQEAKNALQVRQEADIEHPVGLVEHHILDLIEHRILGLDMVQQAPGRGHQHLDAALEFKRLRFHVHAAKNHRTAQLGVLRIGLDRLRNLIGQFARWQQYQRTHRMARRRCGSILVHQHALQKRQRERSGLSGTRLGRSHHVAPLEHLGNRLRLYRRHRLVAQVSDSARQWLCELQLGKGIHLRLVG